MHDSIAMVSENESLQIRSQFEWHSTYYLMVHGLHVGMKQYVSVVSVHKGVGVGPKLAFGHQIGDFLDWYVRPHHPQ